MTHLPKTKKQGLEVPCVIQVVRVSGTIKKAEEEAIKRARAAILKAKRDSGGVDGLLGTLGGNDVDMKNVDIKMTDIEDRDEDDTEDYDENG